MSPVNQTASQNAEEFGFEPGDIVQEWLWDAYAVLGNDGPLWILTPKPGRPGAASSSTVQSAAQTAGMNAATPLTVSSDWNGIRLRAFGKGR